VVVTTTGGVEEDLIKCLAPTFKGDFSLPGAQLRSKGLNRIGNLLVPNDNYCKFEDWIIPIFDKMLEEQNSEVISLLLDKISAFSLDNLCILGCPTCHSISYSQICFLVFYFYNLHIWI